MPDVSFLIAAFNAEHTLEAAVASALAQRDVTVEVIIVDDVSRDGTLSKARELARNEPRLEVLAQQRNMGPAAARNRALATARGDWIAILDADDYLAPERSRTLVALAQERGSQIVADNLVRFRDDAPEIVWPLLPQRHDDVPYDVDLVDYLNCNRMTGGDSTLGYLKPMFSREFLRENGVIYEEGLHIGEDFNFVLKALCAGARFTIAPHTFYFYRAVTGSLSRRLSAADIERLAAVNDSLLDERRMEPGLRRAAAAYRRAAWDLAAYCEFRAAVGQRQWRAALERATAPRLWGTMAQMLAHAARRKRAQRLAAGQAMGAQRRHQQG